MHGQQNINNRDHSTVNLRKIFYVYITAGIQYKVLLLLPIALRPLKFGLGFLYN